MARRLTAGLTAAVLLAGCSPVPVGVEPAGTRGCVVLFQEFDITEARVGSTDRRDGRIAPSELVARGERLRRAGCITRTADITLVDVAPGRPTDGGPPIRPTAVHVGVVTSMEDDARVRAFFEERGLRARSVGSAPLGRRIYVGPLGTQGAIDGVVSLAREAGFIGPYAAFF